MCTVSHASANRLTGRASTGPGRDVAGDAILPVGAEPGGDESACEVADQFVAEIFSGRAEERFPGLVVALLEDCPEAHCACGTG